MRKHHDRADKAKKFMVYFIGFIMISSVFGVIFFGFGSGGATVEDVALMRKVVGSDMEIKASGGIRTKEDAEAMVAAGADRIGASASIAIVTGAASKKGAGGKY